MKKLTLVFVAFLMLTSLSYAQHVFNKGDIAFNGGIGLGGTGGFVPSVEISGEYGAIPTGDIGLVSFGGALGWKYSTYSYDFGIFDFGIDDVHYSQFMFTGRAAWHLRTFESDKWDVYGGVGVGVRLYKDYDNYYYDYFEETWEGTDGEATADFDTEFFVGGRMMLKSNFGLFAEAGYSHLSNVRFGLTFFM